MGSACTQAGLAGRYLFEQPLFFELCGSLNGTLSLADNPAIMHHVTHSTIAPCPPKVGSRHARGTQVEHTQEVRKAHMPHKPHWHISHAHMGQRQREKKRRFSKENTIRGGAHRVRAGRR